MLTLRMLALAAALLLGTPLVIAALPNDAEPDVDGGELVNRNLAAGAQVVDVVLADMPGRVEGRTGAFGNETLVEGHSVFVTLDIEIRLNQTNGTVNVTGFVECSHYADVEVQYFDTVVGDVPFPTRIDRAGADCRVGERVFATPDPFYEPEVQNSGLYPTGRLVPFTTPTGEVGYLEEFAFDLVRENEWGDVSEETYYAFAAPVYAPWLHRDGRLKSFVMPIPTDRLGEGMNDFTIVLEDDPGLFFAQ